MNFFLNILPKGFTFDVPTSMETLSSTFFLLHVVDRLCSYFLELHELYEQRKYLFFEHKLPYDEEFRNYVSDQQTRCCNIIQGHQNSLCLFDMSEVQKANVSALLHSLSSELFTRFFCVRDSVLTLYDAVDELAGQRITPDRSFEWEPGLFIQAFAYVYYNNLDGLMRCVAQDNTVVQGVLLRVAKKRNHTRVAQWLEAHLRHIFERQQRLKDWMKHQRASSKRPFPDDAEQHNELKEPIKPQAVCVLSAEEICNLAKEAYTAQKDPHSIQKCKDFVHNLQTFTSANGLDTLVNCLRGKDRLLRHFKAFLRKHCCDHEGNCKSKELQELFELSKRLNGISSHQVDPDDKWNNQRGDDNTCTDEQPVKRQNMM